MKTKSYTPESVQSALSISRRQQSPSSSILTRSATQAACRSSPSTPTNNRVHSGKIVKPIAVRASSSASTSSSGSSGALRTPKIVNEDFSNFSLIAKYFASFPATRLKSSSPTPSSSFKVPSYVAQPAHEDQLCVNFKRAIKLDAAAEQMHDTCDSIQMETRSTRKFLIKHHYHPYQRQVSGASERVLRSKRPSVDLIKMKRSVANGSGTGASSPPLLTDDLKLVMSNSSEDEESDGSGKVRGVEIGSVCETKSSLSSNADADSGYLSDYYSRSGGARPHHHHHRYNTRFPNAVPCTCDLDLLQIENDSLDDHEEI